MFSKFTTKILIKLANLLEVLAEVIFKSIENKNRPDPVELSSEEVFNFEADPDSPENVVVNTETDIQELQNDNNADEKLRTDHSDTRSKNRSLNPAITSERITPAHHDENYETLIDQEPAVSDSARSPYTSKDLNDNSGKQIEAHVSDSLNLETVNSAANNDGTNDHKKTKLSESSPPLDTIGNKKSDDNLNTISNDPDNSVQQLEQGKEKSRTNDLTDETVSSEINSRDILVKQNELKDLSINESNRAPDKTKPQVSKAPVTPGVGINESLEEWHQSDFSRKEFPPLIVKVKDTVLRQGETSLAHSNMYKRPSMDVTSSNTKTTNSRFRSATEQVPVTAESHWPKLPGASRLKSDSQTELAANWWPELPLETKATESRQLSTETLQVTKTLVREMERIRHLENEQKGMLWNA